MPPVSYIETPRPSISLGAMGNAHAHNASASHTSSVRTGRTAADVAITGSVADDALTAVAAAVRSRSTSATDCEGTWAVEVGLGNRQPNVIGRSQSGVRWPGGRQSATFLDPLRVLNCA
jgi:hypothetical protein